MLKAVLMIVLLAMLTPVQAADRPNFVVIFMDDMAYADGNVFGSPDLETPHLDRMAREGMRFTDFYAAQAVCSASRAALLTGCYSNRVSILGALGPGAKQGLHPDEWTIAEVLKPRGYATAIYGKWHLGDHPQFNPLRHGFDDWFGLPYSNDMWPFHPTAKNFPDLPLMHRDNVVNAKVTPEDQGQLTTQYTERAVAFIEQHREQPFFLYVPHSMPHVPLYVSEKFRGKSKRGVFGDVIAEIDWSVGQILETLKRTGLDEKTLVIFTSDNGPWLSYGNHAGSAGPLREGKGTAWDGGQKEPCLMRWPGRIPAGTVCRGLSGTIDILPTLAHLAGAELPPHPIDGVNLQSLLTDPQSPSPRESFLFYWGRELHAVRAGSWKLHFPHSYRSLKNEPGRDGRPGPYIEQRTGRALYDLSTDPGESKNVLDQHPDIAARLDQFAETARTDLGDALQKRPGSQVRPHGAIE